MKKVGIIKRVLAVGLIFLLSINNFAAIVSDNDGSAFVTKAEFDALKASFNKQVDDYNASIDGKIDGAIASYLAGISLAKVEEKPQLCYIKSGILSPRAGYMDLNFKQGILDWNTYWYFRSNGTAGKCVFSGLSGSDAKYNFGELGINDIYNNGTRYVGSWDGYVTTKQKLVQTGQHLAWGETWKTISDTMKIQPNAVGFIPKSDFDFNHESTELAMYNFSICTTAAWVATDPWGTWSFRAYQNTATRTVLDKKNESIIITPKSVYCWRFSRLDDVYDWYNCQDPLYDTSNVPFKKFTDSNTASDLNEFFASVSCEFISGYGLAPVTYKSISFVKGKSGANSVYYWANGGMAKDKPTDWDTYNSWLPYLGFCTHYKDYNQLYNKLYDAKISPMKEAHKDLNVIKDKNGVEHLALSAGAPIVDVDKNNIVDLDLSFAEKTYDYDVWIKIGSFDADKEPTAETELIPLSNIKVDNALAVSGKASQSFKIPNGQGHVNLTIPDKKDGYLFIKWQYANTAVTGGGTYLPSSSVTVTTLE